MSAELPVGSNVCKCGECGEIFGSVTAFDRHRTGKYPERRCLTNSELRRKGMAMDAYHRWRRQPDAYHAG